MAKILVIDDEEIVRISCVKALFAEGHEVTATESAREAFAVLETAPYDLVLIDLKMPVMDGIEALCAIRAKYPDIEVIVMTGYDTIDHIVESISCGAAHYIGKPFNPDTLIKRINEVLEKCL